MGKKKKKTQLIIDTSTVDEVRARLHRESVNKLKKWQSGMTSQEPKQGTRKNLNSILKKASNKGEVLGQQIEKMNEDRKARRAEREAKKNKKNL